MEIKYTLPCKVNFKTQKWNFYIQHHNSFVKIEESKESVYKCGHCDKVWKSPGGLTLHQRKKHPEVN